MQLIIKDRGEGKTTQLMYTSATTGYPIIVDNKSQKSYIEKKAYEIGIDIPEPIALSDLKNRVYIRSNAVLIDEGYSIIKQALKEFLKCDVAAITLSKSRDISISKDKLKDKIKKTNEKDPYEVVTVLLSNDNIVKK